MTKTNQNRGMDALPAHSSGFIIVLYLEYLFGDSRRNRSVAFKIKVDKLQHILLIDRNSPMIPSYG